MGLRFRMGPSVSVVGGEEDTVGFRVFLRRLSRNDIPSLCYTSQMLCVCGSFLQLKARPSTIKKIMTCFVEMA